MTIVEDVQDGKSIGLMLLISLLDAPHTLQ
jgi:hypothetical protein